MIIHSLWVGLGLCQSIQVKLSFDYGVKVSIILSLLKTAIGRMLTIGQEKVPQSASLRAGVGSSYSILNGDFLLGAFLNRWVKAKKGGRLKRKAFLIGVVSR